jgi:hypothetical protein
MTHMIHIYKSPLPAWQRAFCLGLFLLGSISLSAQAKIKFKDAKQSFGFVKKGEVVKVSFVFSNTGNEDLAITEAKAECSCTTVDFPNYKIKPGQTDTIRVYFDTKSVYDRQDRIVEVISNASNARQNIRFKGVVLK